MKRHFLPALSLVVLLAAFGCANPAADAPQAEVSEPAAPPAAAPAGDAVEYALAGTIGFVGSKVTGSHDGGFNSFDGTVSLVGDTVEASSVNVTIDTTSMWSDNEKLTGHLKSPDFFDVEKYPTATFASTAIAANDDGTYTMTGNLDLHGVSKQISFPATIALTDSGFTANAEFAIKRFDFDIVYAGMPDDLIRDDVLIKLDLQSAAAAADAPAADEGGEPAAY
jgi:polyisoprenoid-binding protein YceI